MTGIAEFLVGTAATAATATTAATAATTGLIGAGGMVTLGGVASAVATGATLLGAASSIAAGNQQSQTLVENSQVSRANAGTALATAEADTARQQRDTQRRVATAANAAGASGVDIGSGSPLDVLSDLSAEGALDATIARWRGITQANAYLTLANQQGRQANQVRDAGYAQAGATLLTGLGRLASVGSSVGGAGVVPKAAAPSAGMLG